jgi:nucleotide-binding universal stress UspA family protein
MLVSMATSSDKSGSSTSVWHGRVVAGVDASDSSHAAAKWAAKEAKIRGRGLTLTSAVLPPATVGGLGIPPALDFLDALHAEAADQLKIVADSLPCEGIETVAEIASPGALLIEASREAHMVVVGSRGTGGFTGLLLGSVGSQVAANAKCPVVVWRGAPHSDASTVVVGIDGSENSQVALGAAFEWASFHDWELVVVHAWDIPAYDLIEIPQGAIAMPIAEIAEDNVRLAAEVLAGYRADFPDVKVREHLVRGPAAKALLDQAINAALIVVGTRGRGQVLSTVLGSVSNSVLHKADIPVLVVPLPAKEEGR